MNKSALRSYARMDAFLIIGVVLALPIPGSYLLPCIILLGLPYRLLFSRKIPAELEEAIRTSVPVPPRTFFRFHRSKDVNWATRLLRRNGYDEQFLSTHDCAALSYPFFTIVKLPEDFQPPDLGTDQRAQLLHELGHAHKWEWFLFSVWTTAAAIGTVLCVLVGLFAVITELFEDSLASLLQETDPALEPLGWDTVWVCYLGFLIFTGSLVQRGRFAHRVEFLADEWAAKIDCDAIEGYLKRRARREKYTKAASAKVGELNEALHPSFVSRLQAIKKAPKYTIRQEFLEFYLFSLLFLVQALVGVLVLAIDWSRLVPLIIYCVVGAIMLVDLLKWRNLDVPGSLVLLARSIGISLGFLSVCVPIIVFLMVDGFAEDWWPWLIWISSGLVLWAALCALFSSLERSRQLPHLVFGTWGLITLVPSFLLAAWAINMLNVDVSDVWIPIAAAAFLPVSYVAIVWLSNSVATKYANAKN